VALRDAFVRVPTILIVGALALACTTPPGSSSAVKTANDKKPERVIEVPTVVVTPLDDGQIQAEFERAKGLVLAGEHRAAAEIFDKLAKARPDVEPPCIYNAAVAYESYGAWDESLARLRELLRRFPGYTLERNALMRSVAAELAAKGARPYVIPEGGSNGVGSLGYVEAMREVRAQIDGGLAGDRRAFDVVVHACGSGGTAAGVALGASAFDVAREVRPMAVCDDKRTFEETIARVVTEARAADPSLGEPAPVSVDDRERGPRYGVASAEQEALIGEVARASGWVLDPVYTGKAFAGFVRLAREGALDGKRVLFLHTGGLPGLLADSASLRAMLP
jgi:1-aminocyclopropane-1-carboxylate deaminase/D-cysteine desulfhydrase-like pyridoxal-dependent ACC family enzyme